MYNLDQASGTSSEGGFSHPNALNVPGSHLMNLRLRLAPLLSMEKDLIDRLGADYFTDAETGVKQVFVRRGWQYIQPVEREQTRAEAYAAQARAKLNATPKLRAPNSGNAPRPSEDDDDDDYSRRRASMEADETISDVSSIMHQLSDDIGRLWILPDTQGLLRRRKVQLSEAATLYVNPAYSRAYFSDLRLSPAFWVRSRESLHPNGPLPTMIFSSLAFGRLVWKSSMLRFLLIYSAPLV